MFFCIHALKQALSHGLILKKVDRVIQFTQKAWLKPYNDMNTEIRKEAQNDSEKDFFKLMNNAVFRKTMEDVRKQICMKLVRRDERRNRLAPIPNYYTAKHFSENLMAKKIEKTRVKMNKPVYCGMSILDISKTLMYEFGYDFIKPKYKYKGKLYYMDTDGFFIHIETEDFYKYIANDVEKWFDTSNYSKDDNRLLPIGKTK